MPVWFQNRFCNGKVNFLHFRRKFRESPGARFANSFVDVTWRGKVPAGSDSKHHKHMCPYMINTFCVISETASLSMCLSLHVDMCADISAADRTVYGSLAVDRADPYGYEYIFYLKDAIDSCPEFLVHFDTFQTYISFLFCKAVLFNQSCVCLMWNS